MAVQERQNPYSGRVEVWVDDVKRHDALVSLAESVEYDILPSGERFYGRWRWGGHLSELTRENLAQLMSLPQGFELRFPAGQTGRAVLEDMTTGRITGTLQAPWTIQP